MKQKSMTKSLLTALAAMVFLYVFVGGWTANVGGVTLISAPTANAQTITKHSISGVSRATVTSRRTYSRTCPIMLSWHEDRQWQSRLLHHIQMWDAIDNTYCTNNMMTRIKSVPYQWCYSRGGYFTYDGCRAVLGDPGYSYMGAHATYHWHWVINGAQFDRTQEIVYKLYANGRVEWTWYWWG